MMLWVYDRLASIALGPNTPQKSKSNWVAPLAETFMCVLLTKMLQPKQEVLRFSIFSAWLGAQDIHTARAPRVSPCCAWWKPGAGTDLSALLGFSCDTYNLYHHKNSSVLATQKNTSPLKSAASATWTDQRDGSDNTGLSCCLRLPGRENFKAEHWFIHYLFSDPVENKPVAS